MKKYTLNEADKSRFIKKHPNLTDEQKEEIIKVLQNPQTAYLEDRIDWNKVNKMSYEEIKKALKATTKFERREIRSIKQLKKDEDYEILFRKDDYEFILIKTYKASKLFASNDYGKPCWCDIPWWYQNDDPTDDYLYDESSKLYSGAKWCIAMNHTDSFFNDYSPKSSFVFMIGNKSNDKYALQISKIDEGYDAVWNFEDDKLESEGAFKEYIKEITDSYLNLPLRNLKGGMYLMFKNYLTYISEKQLTSLDMDRCLGILKRIENTPFIHTKSVGYHLSNVYISSEELDDILNKKFDESTALLHAITKAYIGFTLFDRYSIAEGGRITCEKLYKVNEFLNDLDTFMESSSILFCEDIEDHYKWYKEKFNKEVGDILVKCGDIFNIDENSHVTLKEPYNTYFFSFDNPYSIFNAMYLNKSFDNPKHDDKQYIVDLDGMFDINNIPSIFYGTDIDNIVPLRAVQPLNRFLKVKKNMESDSKTLNISVMEYYEYYSEKFSKEWYNEINGIIDSTDAIMEKAGCTVGDAKKLQSIFRNNDKSTIVEVVDYRVDIESVTPSDGDTPIINFKVDYRELFEYFEENEMNESINKLEEASKDRFIKKHPNLTDEQKEELLAVINDPKTAYKAGKIDWNKVNSMTYEDLAEILLGKKLTKFERRKIKNLNQLKEGVDYDIISVGEKYTMFLILSYKASVLIASNDVGVECWTPLPNWYQHDEPTDDYLYNEEEDTYSGAKWCIAMNHTDHFWKQYTEDYGHIFVFMIGDEENEKYAFTLNVSSDSIDVESVWDAPDEMVLDENEYLESDWEELSFVKTFESNRKLLKKCLIKHELYSENYLGDLGKTPLGKLITQSEVYKQSPQKTAEWVKELISDIKVKDYFGINKDFSGIYVKYKTSTDTTESPIINKLNVLSYNLLMINKEYFEGLNQIAMQSMVSSSIFMRFLKDIKDVYNPLIEKFVTTDAHFIDESLSTEFEARVKTAEECASYLVNYEKEIIDIDKENLTFKFKQSFVDKYLTPKENDIKAEFNAKALSSRILPDSNGNKVCKNDEFSLFGLVRRNYNANVPLTEKMVLNWINRIFCDALYYLKWNDNGFVNVCAKGNYEKELSYAIDKAFDKGATVNWLNMNIIVYYVECNSNKEKATDVKHFLYAHSATDYDEISNKAFSFFSDESKITLKYRAFKGNDFSKVLCFDVDDFMQTIGMIPMKESVEKIEEASKDRFIDKNPNLTDEQKTEIKAVLAKYPNLEKNIDWNHSSEYTYPDFKELIVNKAGKSRNQKKKHNGLENLEEGKDYEVLRSDENFDVFLVLSYNASVTIASNAVEPKTESPLPYWYTHEKPSDDYTYTDKIASDSWLEDNAPTYPQEMRDTHMLNDEIWGGAKWCIAMKHTSKFWKDYASESFFIFVCDKSYSKKYALTCSKNHTIENYKPTSVWDDFDVEIGSLDYFNETMTEDEVIDVVWGERADKVNEILLKHGLVRELSNVNELEEYFDTKLGVEIRATKEYAENPSNMGSKFVELMKFVDNSNALMLTESFSRTYITIEHQALESLFNIDVDSLQAFENIKYVIKAIPPIPGGLWSTRKGYISTYIVPKFNLTALIQQRSIDGKFTECFEVLLKVLKKVEDAFNYGEIFIDDSVYKSYVKQKESAIRGVIIDGKVRVQHGGNYYTEEELNPFANFIFGVTDSFPSLKVVKKIVGKYKTIEALIKATEDYLEEEGTAVVKDSSVKMEFDRLSYMMYLTK